MTAMTYSKAGEELTKHFEGLSLVAYWDAKGRCWTIGYGHTKGVYASMTVTQQQAEGMLTQDIADAVRDVNREVMIPLEQNEFDALVDFVLNLGDAKFHGSTLLRLINSNDIIHAAEEFERWEYAGGVKVAGLLRRRLAEETLFKSGPKP